MRDIRDIQFNITKAEEGAAFAVQVVPQSKKNEVIGKYGDALKINLIAKGVGGSANEMLLNFIAEKLNVERKNLEIAAGKSSTRKMVIVVGLTPATVEDLLLN